MVIRISRQLHMCVREHPKLSVGSFESSQHSSPVTVLGFFYFALQKLEQVKGFFSAVAFQLIRSPSIPPYSYENFKMKRCALLKAGCLRQNKDMLAADVHAQMNKCPHIPFSFVSRMKSQRSSFGALPPNACDSVDWWVLLSTTDIFST